MPSTSKQVPVRSKRTTSHVDPNSPAQRSRRKWNSSSLYEPSLALAARILPFRGRPQDAIQACIERGAAGEGAGADQFLDRPLEHPPADADALHQAPVEVRLAVILSLCRSQKHAGIISHPAMISKEAGLHYTASRGVNPAKPPIPAQCRQLSVRKKSERGRTVESRGRPGRRVKNAQPLLRPLFEPAT